MNIPSYWSVHTAEVSYNNQLTKIKRYGWSDVSVAAAKQHSIERCQEAEQTLLTTGNVKRIEAKGSYAVAGLPIREEVVKKYPDLNCITTINIYGSTCLNTEDVMVLDIDNNDLKSFFVSQFRGTKKAKPKSICLVWALLPVVLLLIIATLSGGTIDGGLRLFLFGVIGGLLAMLLSYINSKRHHNWFVKQGGYAGMLDSFVNPFLEKHPDMVFNIYRTPLGFRLLALDNTYLPSDTATQHCFDELPVDKNYARLCQVQNCFRARVTAKPWNISDCDPHIPFKDFWVDNRPEIKPLQQDRQEWLQHYHELASLYAACEFVKQVGKRHKYPFGSAEHKTQQYVDRVIALHDELSRSHSDLSVA